jgi:hypothetical protein
MRSHERRFESFCRQLSHSRFRPQLEVLEDRRLLSGGLSIVGLLPSSIAMGSLFSIRVSTIPPNLSQGPANPVTLTVVDPLNLAHLVGQMQGTPDAKGNVLFVNLSFDSVGTNLEILATQANTKASATSNPVLVYAHATRTKDQVNLYEGKYENLEGGFPYPLSVEYIARHLAENYDASVFTHLIDNAGDGTYGLCLDRAYPHLVEVMKLVKILHPGFEIMGYVPAFTDEPTLQGYIPGGWEPANGECTGFENWANAWANLQTDSGAPLVDTLFLDYISPWIEGEDVKEQIYSYAKSLGMHIVVNAPIYTNNFQFAIDSPYMTAGDGVMIEGAMRFNGRDYDWYGNWIPAYTINSELLWAYNYKSQGIRLFFLSTESSGATIRSSSRAGRIGESYAHRYGASGFTYTNATLNNVNNTLNPVSNAVFLSPAPTIASHLMTSMLSSSLGNLGPAGTNPGVQNSSTSLVDLTQTADDESELPGNMEMTERIVVSKDRCKTSFSSNDTVPSDQAALTEPEPDVVLNQTDVPNKSDDGQDVSYLDQMLILNPAPEVVVLAETAMPAWILALPFLGLVDEWQESKENRKGDLSQ